MWGLFFRAVRKEAFATGSTLRIESRTMNAKERLLAKCLLVIFVCVCMRCEEGPSSMV